MISQICESIRMMLLSGCFTDLGLETDARSSGGHPESPGSPAHGHSRGCCSLLLGSYVPHAGLSLLACCGLPVFYLNCSLHKLPPGHHLHTDRPHVLLLVSLAGTPAFHPRQGYRMACFDWPAGSLCFSAPAHLTYIV